ncbi:Uncharacterized protein Fot_35673 [Forsythia ovata]|uniref:Uncharacterized protein n=1 Tax=Forsythia ovata TaxID=205694 RepID=A0ABD1SMH9_9LAMI
MNYQTAVQIRGYQNLNCVDSEATSSLGSLLGTTTSLGEKKSPSSSTLIIINLHSNNKYLHTDSWLRAIWNVTNQKWVHSAVVNSRSLRKWVVNSSEKMGAQSLPAFAEHDIRTQCDWVRSQIDERNTLYHTGQWCSSKALSNTFPISGGRNWNQPRGGVTAAENCC